jgi:hypothetical protein
MRTVSRIGASRLLMASLCLPLFASQVLLAQTTVRQVKVLGGKGAVEIEVEASERIVPQTQVLAGPDRLVIDFPNAVPGGQLRSQSLNVGEVKDVRVGLFQSKPPVTRVVVDLKSAQSYQVFPYGRTVMIKVIGGRAPGAAAAIEEAPEQTRPGLVTANYTTARGRIRVDTPAKPALEVSFRDGQLTIHANKATLSEVLVAVQQRTGAEISLAAGAEQERVVADLGPAPAQEVLAHLLNGSRFNFLIMNAVSDPGKLARVILSPRLEGAIVPPPVQAANDSAAIDASPAQPMVSQPPPPPPPGARPENIPRLEDDTPDQ